MLHVHAHQLTRTTLELEQREPVCRRGQLDRHAGQHSAVAQELHDRRGRRARALGHLKLGVEGGLGRKDSLFDS